jgi:hypothetical protein
MANITVKKSDGTTDVTFTAVTASGGDKSPAVWRNDAFGGTIGQRPELRVRSAPNGSLTHRKVDGSFTMPQLYTDTTTSLSKVATRANVQWTSSIPMDMSDAQLAEFAAQFGNLLASSLIKSIHASGYAAT